MPTDESSVYAVRPPCAALLGVVRCVWRYRWLAPERRVERIPPDGCPELIVNFGAGYAELTGEGTLLAQPAALFAGQITRPLTLIADGPVDTVGVRFEPDGARDFVRRPMNELTNARVALTEFGHLDASALLRALAASRDEERFDVLQSLVAATIGNNRTDDPLVSGALQELAKGGPIETKNVSLRQLQRRFIDRVGVSMREIQSILRFRRVFDEIGREPDWTRSALAAGYFDQAQLARDFRRYLGCTASDWARQKIGLAAEIARETSQTYKLAAADARKETP